MKMVVFFIEYIIEYLFIRFFEIENLKVNKKIYNFTKIIFDFNFLLSKNINLPKNTILILKILTYKILCNLKIYKNQIYNGINLTNKAILYSAV